MTPTKPAGPLGGQDLADGGPWGFPDPPAWLDPATRQWVAKYLRRRDANVRRMPEFIGDVRLATSAHEAGWCAGRFEEMAEDVAKAKRGAGT